MSHDQQQQKKLFGSESLAFSNLFFSSFNFSSDICVYGCCCCFLLMCNWDIQYIFLNHFDDSIVAHLPYSFIFVLSHFVDNFNKYLKNEMHQFLCKYVHRMWLKVFHFEITTKSLWKCTIFFYAKDLHVFLLFVERFIFLVKMGNVLFKFTRTRKQNRTKFMQIRWFEMHRERARAREGYWDCYNGSWNCNYIWINRCSASVKVQWTKVKLDKRIRIKMYLLFFSGDAQCKADIKKEAKKKQTCLTIRKRIQIIILTKSILSWKLFERIPVFSSCFFMKSSWIV